MLTRLEWLVGPDKIQRLKDTSIALFGVGGVGGGALEALVRAGVGRIVIIDGDSIAPSNLNRQMITTHNTIGERKVDVAKARALSINPDVVIETHDIMYTEEKYPGFIQSLNVDYAIDAIDMVQQNSILSRFVNVKAFLLFPVWAAVIAFTQRNL